MSRAFVTDKEDWVYCAKAGERCLHASADRECRQTDCQYYNRVIDTPAADPLASQQGLKVVRRRTGSASGRTDPASSSPDGARSTKRANIKPPRKWGGRSG